MSDASIRIAIVGMGKIARDQHVPALTASGRFELVAVADPHAQWPGVACFDSLDALLADGPPIDAVALCTPPRGRAALALQAIAKGLHVLSEKPPAATLSEAIAMRDAAAARGITLYATWHSRMAGAVAPVRAWLADKAIEKFTITWAEDIRRWHPGQDWILAAGGFGVFDPGINALSIATAILPHGIIVDSATMTIPEGRAAPISARLALTSGPSAGTAEFDFLRQGEQHWTIDIVTREGTVTVGAGGATLRRDGVAQDFTDQEYPHLYARFADLIAAKASDVDLAPLALVADAFLLAQREVGPPFAW